MTVMQVCVPHWTLGFTAGLRPGRLFGMCPLPSRATFGLTCCLPSSWSLFAARPPSPLADRASARKLSVKGEVTKNLEKQQVTINLVCLPGVFCFTQAPPSLPPRLQHLLFPERRSWSTLGCVWDGGGKSCKTDYLEAFFVNYL